MSFMPVRRMARRSVAGIGLANRKPCPHWQPKTKQPFLLLGLDALGNDIKSEIVRQIDDRADDGGVLGVRAQVPDETPIDLQARDRKPFEQTQGRVPVP